MKKRLKLTGIILIFLIATILIQNETIYSSNWEAGAKKVLLKFPQFLQEKNIKGLKQICSKDFFVQSKSFSNSLKFIHFYKFSIDDYSKEQNIINYKIKTNFGSKEKKNFFGSYLKYSGVISVTLKEENNNYKIVDSDLYDQGRGFFWPLLIPFIYGLYLYIKKKYKKK